MTQARPRLRHALGMRALFMLAFGTMIGVGWMIVAGEWINGAGPGGAIIGFVGGAVMIMFVAVCYAELAGIYPVSGGEVAYAYDIYGSHASFVIAWMLVLAYGVIVPFEFVAVGWVFTTLAPSLEGPVLYALLGHEIHLGGVAAGLAASVLIGAANYRGVKTAARLQDILALALVAVTVIFVVYAVNRGDAANLEPFIAPNEKGSIFKSITIVLITTPLWFAGFDVVAQAMGEKANNAPMRKLGALLCIAIGAALLFYCAVIFATAIAVPRADLLGMELPVAGAMEAAFNHSFGAQLVLVAGLFGLMTSWNAVFLATTRLIYAMGRGRMIPPVFGEVHVKHLTPSNAVVFVLVIGIFFGLLGRGAINPIISVSALVYTAVFMSMCVGMFIMRVRAPDKPRPYRAPSIAFPIIASVSMGWLFWLTLSEGMERAASGTYPIEWFVLAVWMAFGLLLWVAAKPWRRKLSSASRRAMILELNGSDDR